MQFIGSLTGFVWIFGVCKTSFCRKDVLLKHIKKNCKIKKIFDEKQLTEKKINNNIDELKKEIENLKLQITIISNKK